MKKMKFKTHLKILNLNFPKFEFKKYVKFFKKVSNLK